MDQPVMRERDLHGAPAYVVRRRDGRFLQQREPVVGFHWQTSGIAWVRAVRYASKLTRTLARIAAVEHGGEVSQFIEYEDQQAPALEPPQAPASRRCSEIDTGADRPRGD